MLMRSRWPFAISGSNDSYGPMDIELLRKKSSRMTKTQIALTKLAPSAGVCHSSMKKMA